jgi:tRNA pseudouridine55 synthase
MPTEQTHGLLVLDKPLGITSRAAVDCALRWFPRGTRVGHTGTLDPLATGVLVLCVGRATRLTEFIQDMGKTYVTDVVFGARSATDDGEGPVTPVEVVEPPERMAVAAAVQSFVGTIAQVPPAYSAAKLAGRRAYDLARRGQDAMLQPRTVRIDCIDILEYCYPILRLAVRCGKGTYIRSLARDLGERLNCGGYVSALRRSRVGPFTPDQAVPADADADTARSRLLPTATAVAGLPRIDLAHAAARRFCHGQVVPVPDGAGTVREAVAVFSASGDLVGIGRVDPSGGTLRPLKVFAVP